MSMRAIQIQAYGGPEMLREVSLPIPEVRPGTVLVKVETIGVGRPDILLRTGVYKWKPPLPSVVGCEAVGHVTAVGDGVEGVAVGAPMLVFHAALGCYAEYVVAPLEHIAVLPEGLDLDLAIHLPNYVTAYALLHDGARGCDPAALYLNGAAGGLGVAITQLARHRGIAVITGASSAEKCAFLMRYGASHTVNYGAQDQVSEVLRLTSGRGVDLFLDQMVGPRFTDNLDMLAPLGMVVSFNVLQGFPEEDLFAQLRARLTKCLAVRCFSVHMYDSNPARRQEIQRAVIDIFLQGVIDPPVHDVLPLGEARKAHEWLEARAVLGKLLLKP